MELINSELKCLDRWLKSNKISINADKTKYMLFSYNKNVNFSDISVGNNTINATSVTKFLGIHLDKKLHFVNHITEMSMKVAKSIGLLHKLNRFLPETILKMLYTSLIHPYLSYGIEPWHGTFQNNTSKIFVLQKKAIGAINNLAYNEHTNAYFKCNKILKFSDEYKLQISNYIFQVLHSNIDEEIKLSLLINNKIHSHNTRTNNKISILRVNRSKTKHCVLHNGMIMWNSLPDIFKVNIPFQCSRARYKIFI